jgi:hypothetical protein
MYAQEEQLLERIIAHTCAGYIEWTNSTPGMAECKWRYRKFVLTSFRGEPYRLTILHHQSRGLVGAVEGDAWGASQRVWKLLVDLSRLAMPALWAAAAIEIDRFKLPPRPADLIDPLACELNRLLQ